METNIVVFEVRDAAAVVRRCADDGVLIGALDRRHARAVTHLDVDAEGIEHAAKVLGQALTETY